MELNGEPNQVRRFYLSRTNENSLDTDLGRYDNGQPWKHARPEGAEMQSLLCLFLICAVMAPTSPVADVASFRHVKVLDPKGTQTDAEMILQGFENKIVVRVAGSDFVTIPFGTLDKVSYQYSKKHRITSGAIVMAACLSAGAVVMLTKSKSHWLYLDYHEGVIPRTIIFRMDKNEYRKMLAALETYTGKSVENLGDEKQIQKKKPEKKKK